MTEHTLGFEKIVGAYDLALETAKNQGFTHCSFSGKTPVPIYEIGIDIAPEGLFFKWGDHRATLREFLEADFSINYTK